MGRRLAAWLFALIVLTGCSNISSSSADWVSAFVVWDDYIYRVSEEYILEVDEEIGNVTAYSDREAIYSGNFSNTYEKGTKYFAITGTSTGEAIAIEEGGKYRKAVRNGKYAGN